MDKCQYYTYDSNSEYEPYNDVVVNYVQRAMVNIKAAQQQIISDYAGECMVDIATCYNQQVSQVNSWSSTASINSIYNVMRGACHNVALTCAYAVFADDTTGLCVSDSTCIDNISEMFYQSLLCPDNSVYQSTTDDVDEDGTLAGWVNESCKCVSGYVVWGGECSKTCLAGRYRSSAGVCTNCPIGTYWDGAYETSSCTECNAGYTTSSTGATSSLMCVDE